jgi:hypothetical protein
MPEFPSATKIGLFGLTTGLFLATIIAVLVLVGSIFFLGDQSSEDGHINQQSTQSLAGDNPERNNL